MLRRAMGVGVYGSAQISFTKVCSPMLRGGGWVSDKKRYVNLDGPLD